MRLATVLLNDVATPGLLARNHRSVYPLRGYDDTLDFLTAGPDAWDIDPEDLNDPSRYENFQRILAPIVNPPKLICIGLNYRDHALESNMELPKTPVVFTKFANSIIGPGDTVVLPKASTQPDYEAELAIVIGVGGRNIPAAAWKKHVFGCTIINDISARDIQLATSQWSLGKSFDTFCPMGPAIVSLDELGDPHQLAIKLDVDGEYLQDSNTDELVFKTGELIAYLSSIMTLSPGDIISTGTPAGVGLGRNPKRWIKPGETMTVEIEGIGKLTSPVKAE
jgi:2-keto-4-pentenoate hydratase/2-oxohepta-3-ene-1,7-dioic acid hydratase in catechol pathway